MPKKQKDKAPNVDRRSEIRRLLDAHLEWATACARGANYWLLTGDLKNASNCLLAAYQSVEAAKCLTEIPPPKDP